jgi:hypothetical protein
MRKGCQRGIRKCVRSRYVLAIVILSWLFCCLCVIGASFRFSTKNVDRYVEIEKGELRIGYNMWRTLQTLDAGELPRQRVAFSVFGGLSIDARVFANFMSIYVYANLWVMALAFGTLGLLGSILRVVSNRQRLIFRGFPVTRDP